MPLGGNIAPSKCCCNAPHWQQYYATSYVAYHGHAAQAVPQCPARPSGVSGTFYLTLNLSISASLLISWVRLGLKFGLRCCCYRGVQWHQYCTPNHIGQAAPAVPRRTAQPRVSSGAFYFQILLVYFTSVITICFN